MKDLKPCPFCGSPGIYDPDIPTEQCGRCGALGPGYGGADVGWNDRASPWRSLKDDPPTEGTWITIRKRLASGELIYACMCTNYFLVGACEYMEIPE